MDCDRHLNIDLHIHTTASDGTFTPAEALQLAQKLKLGAIAITDHDTVDGAKEALRIGIPESMKFLTGVEISAKPPSHFNLPATFHILGYAIDLENSELNQTLVLLQDVRKNRNPKILDRLRQLDIVISLEEVKKEAGNGQLGRPHIAKVMMKKGFVESIDEAFDKFLGKRKPAYVDKYRISCKRAITLIKNAGGLPVLAHPYLLDFPNDDTLEELMVHMKGLGLIGIEVYYPEHSPERINHYKSLADLHNLIMTGGTDFHGNLKPEIQMGYGLGDFMVPYSLYEKIMETR